MALPGAVDALICLIMSAIDDEIEEQKHCV